MVLRLSLSSLLLLPVGGEKVLEVLRVLEVRPLLHLLQKLPQGCSLQLFLHATRTRRRRRRKWGGGLEERARKAKPSQRLTTGREKKEIEKITRVRSADPPPSLPALMSETITGHPPRPPSRSEGKNQPNYPPPPCPFGLTPSPSLTQSDSLQSAHRAGGGSTGMEFVP